MWPMPTSFAAVACEFQHSIPSPSCKQPETVEKSRHHLQKHRQKLIRVCVRDLEKWPLRNDSLL
jgi:hypothetical protein